MNINNSSFKLIAHKHHGGAIGLCSFLILLGVIILIFYFIHPLQFASNNHWLLLLVAFFILIPIISLIILYRNFAWKLFINIKKEYIEIINPKKNKTISTPLNKCSFKFLEHESPDIDDIPRVYHGPVLVIKSNDFKINITTNKFKLRWKNSEGKLQSIRFLYELDYDNWIKLLKELGFQNKITNL